MELCGYQVGLDRPFFLIAGTCSIESLQMSLDVAGLFSAAELRLFLAACRHERRNHVGLEHLPGLGLAD